MTGDGSVQHRLPRHAEFYLQAAIGWLELGNSTEANLELNRIPPEYANEPVVLETRWQILAQQRNWREAAEIARLLRDRDPENPFGWIHFSYSLHELKRTQEAWDSLLPAAAQFPHIWNIPYNLACYAAQMGMLERAAELLRIASRTGDPKEIQRIAAHDPDLEPLRKTNPNSQFL